MHNSHKLFLAQPLILTLLDIPVMMDALEGVKMELQDCALTLLKGWENMSGHAHSAIQNEFGYRVVSCNHIIQPHMHISEPSLCS